VITRAALLRIMPYARRRIDAYLAPLNAAMLEFGIDTPARQAAFLSQIGHETGQLQFVEEIASGIAYEGRKDLGNMVRGDGVRFKGRGLIMITGRGNYAACGAALGLDLILHPELLLVPVNACRSAAWFWQTHGLNKWADAGDIDGVSDVINRGRKTAAIGDANGYSDRVALYNVARRELA
jgi:putative chitinase